MNDQRDFIGLLSAVITMAVAMAATGAAETGQELPTYRIPNVPSAGEAYYAPDNLHLITAAKDKDARPNADGSMAGLTYTFTDKGEDIRRINDRGQDACSYFFPNGKRIVWTSTRDNLDMPPGNWSEITDYPKPAELYVSDLDGRNIVRLTNNKVYDAEVSVSPDGKWVVFGRQEHGDDDLWRIRPDGSGEQQITKTTDWQEGAPFYMPDSETILFRARLKSEQHLSPPPITVFTIRHDGTNLKQRTFDKDMNWAPYPAPDGRHYVFVRVVQGKNWEVFLGDLTGGAPRRLTFHEGFDGLPALSPDGKKMVFARSVPETRGSWLHVMDVSSLKLGPENYKGID
jgi:Tol biopolymer transport system component